MIWLWTKISGPAFFNIVLRIVSAKATVHESCTGRYLFELRVKDNGGLLAKDTVQIVVIDPAQPNRPPVAIAGRIKLLLYQRIQLILMATDQLIRTITLLHIFGQKYPAHHHSILIMQTQFKYR